MFDTPQQHPRISETERDYILENIGSSMTEEVQGDVPWKEILTSGPLWITTIAHWGGVWGFLTFMTEAPTYLTHIHGWNINAVSFIERFNRLIFFFSIRENFLCICQKIYRNNSVFEVITDSQVFFCM